jgi:hypothetical protein
VRAGREFDMTKEQAIALAESKWWEGKSARDIAMFQIFAADCIMCMPFDLLLKAVSEALGRPVFNVEFTSKGVERLKTELLTGGPAPTMDDILALIPEEKRVILAVEPEGGGHA